MPNLNLLLDIQKLKFVRNTAPDNQRDKGFKLHVQLTPTAVHILLFEKSLTTSVWDTFNFFQVKEGNDLHEMPEAPSEDWSLNYWRQTLFLLPSLMLLQTFNIYVKCKFLVKQLKTLFEINIYNKAPSFTR